MGYLRPTDGRTLCSRDCHRGRNPPSQEAGTDIWAAFGTPLRAAAAGTVFEVGGGTGPATGYFVTIDLDDGRRIRYLHLWARYVSRGDRVSRGTIFAQSGGSGYGSMTAAGGAGTVGQHVHVTLWPTHSYSFGTNANTLDFEQYADPMGAEAPASTGSQPFNQSEEDDMRIIYSQHLNRLYLIGDGGITHLVSDDAAKAYNAIGVPGNRFTNQLGKNDFRMVVEGLGLSYERTRLLKPGERLEKDTRTNVVENAVAVLDAGNVPWGPDWA